VVFELDHRLALLEPIQMMHKGIFAGLAAFMRENGVMLM
jgi:hypothetical protein